MRQHFLVDWQLFSSKFWTYYILKNITVMEKTIFKRFLQLLGSKGGIVFEIYGDKVVIVLLYINILILSYADFASPTLV